MSQLRFRLRKLLPSLSESANQEKDREVKCASRSSAPSVRARKVSSSLVRRVAGRPTLNRKSRFLTLEKRLRSNCQLIEVSLCSRLSDFSKTYLMYENSV